ncbi:hypothetical protein N7470_006196 [Penicillium chermesinum]|nr:hypothetical protein N7470_006196 [Penicillium chermesinum]
MERKLSQKAAQMRQRFTLKTRPSQTRERASTMTTSRPASSASHRSRSATTPHEPGYFRPASPLLERQDIAEQVEDDVKHACALLVHSIDRGLPMWPSLEAETACRPDPAGLVNPSPPEPPCTSQDHPGYQQWDKQGPLPKDQHDSGVGMSFQSPGKSNRAAPNSFSASAGTGRFYGKRNSMSPPAKESERGRARGRSFATHSTSESRSRSRSSSPAFFPYSPPQMDFCWGFTQEPRSVAVATGEPLPQSALLGAQGMAWLKASFDRSGSDDSQTLQPQSNDHAGMVSAPGTAAGPPDAAPCRFYSTRRLPSESRLKSHEWAGFGTCESRDSIIHTSLSMQSITGRDEEKRAQNHAYPDLG